MKSPTFDNIRETHLSESDVEKSLDYLRDNAVAAAQSRANRIYMEEYRKTVKAQIMQEHIDKPISAQEREAYADPRYIRHLQAYRQAIEADERHRFLLAAAEAKIDAWRTQCSNERAMKL